ncbi:MAG: ABC transporter substrate-binding protein [Chloroflexota bacterium]
MRKVYTILTVMIALFLMIACSANPNDTQTGSLSVTDSDPIDEPTILRFGANAADLKTLDPHMASTTNDRAVADMVFNALVRFEPGNPANLEPDLAVAIPEPEMVDGQQVWTFELQQGIMCHPGPQTDAYELTADDVVYSITRAADTNRSAYAGTYTGFSAETIDPYTVQITVETPTSPSLFLPKVADLSGGFVVCSRAVEAMGDEAFKTHPVGTGPFVFEEYTPQTSVRLLANPDYFRGRAELDGVDIIYMPDNSSRELALRAGELDLIYGQKSDVWVNALEAEEHLNADIFNTGAVATIHFNTKIAPFDDPRVRQAVAYALNREAFGDLFGPTIAFNILSPIPSDFISGGIPDPVVEEMGLAYHFDLEQAKALLAEAGYGDGFELEVVTSEMEAYRKIYEGIQGQLTDVGIDLKVNMVDHSTMHSLIRQDANPLTVYFALGATPDIILTRYHHSASTVVTGEKPDANFSHYDQIDHLIEDARSETDPAAQFQLWQDAQVQILEDASSYPLFIMAQVYGRSANLDYGHELLGSMSFYPQITEKTRLVNQ